MNFRNSDDEKEGSSYKIYLERKVKVLLAAHDIAKSPQSREKMHAKITAAGIYSSYMEKMKQAVSDKIGIDISYAELDIIFPILLDGARRNNIELLRTHDAIKHMEELSSVNRLLDLKNDLDHFKTITKLVLGIDPLEKLPEEVDEKLTKMVRSKIDA